MQKYAKIVETFTHHDERWVVFWLLEEQRSETMVLDREMGIKITSGAFVRLSTDGDGFSGRYIKVKDLPPNLFDQLDPGEIEFANELQRSRTKAYIAFKKDAAFKLAQYAKAVNDW